jgi:hypothetical protein
MSLERCGVLAILALRIIAWQSGSAPSDSTPSPRRSSLRSATNARFTC